MSLRVGGSFAFDTAWAISSRCPTCSEEPLGLEAIDGLSQPVFGVYE